jgi:hypothetical protein
MEHGLTPKHSRISVTRLVQRSILHQLGIRVKWAGRKSKWHHNDRNNEANLQSTQRKWPDELIKVVWSHNTTASRSTGFTPFKLLFGDEAITPEEAKAGSIRTIASAEDEADYQVTKDTIEGTRLQAIEHINKY